MTYEDFLRLQGQQPGFGFGTLGGNQVTPGAVPPITEVPAPQNIPQITGQPIDWKQIAQQKALEMINAPDQKESPLMPLGMALISMGQQMQVPPALRGQNNNLQSMANALMAWQMRQQQIQESGNLKKVGALSTLQKMSEGEKPIVVGNALIEPRTGKEIYRGDKFTNVTPGATVLNTATGQPLYTAPEKPPLPHFYPVTDASGTRLTATDPRTLLSTTVPGTEGVPHGGQLLLPMDGKGPAIEWHPGSPIPEGYGPASQVKMQVNDMSPEAIDMAAHQYRITGLLPSLGMGGAQVKTRILDKAAEQMLASGEKPIDPIVAKTQLGAFKSELSQLQAQRGKVLAFAETAHRNIDQALELSQKVDRTGVPIFNKWLQAGQREIAGNPEVSAFHAANRIAINEIAKVTSSATGGQVTSDSARKEIEDTLKTAQTPEQYIAVVNTLRQDMQNRVAGYDSQINRINSSIKMIGEHGQNQPQGQPMPQRTTSQTGFRRELTNKRTGEKRIITDPAEYQRLTGQTP